MFNNFWSVTDTISLKFRVTALKMKRTIKTKMRLYQSHQDM